MKNHVSFYFQSHFNNSFLFIRLSKDFFSARTTLSDFFYDYLQWKNRRNSIVNAACRSKSVEKSISALSIIAKAHSLKTMCLYKIHIINSDIYMI